MAVGLRFFRETGLQHQSAFVFAALNLFIPGGQADILEYPALLERGGRSFDLEVLDTCTEPPSLRSLPLQSLTAIRALLLLYRIGRTSGIVKN